MCDFCGAFYCGFDQKVLFNVWVDFGKVKVEFHIICLVVFARLADYGAYLGIIKNKILFDD